MILLVSLKKKQIVCSVCWDFLLKKKSSLEKILEHSFLIEKYISGFHRYIIFLKSQFSSTNTYGLKQPRTFSEWDFFL